MKGGGAEAAELRPRPAGSFRTERGWSGRAHRAALGAGSCRRGLAARGGPSRRPAARSPTAPGTLVCGVRKRQHGRARRAPLRALACLDGRAAILRCPSLECCASEAVACSGGLRVARAPAGAWCSLHRVQRVRTVRSRGGCRCRMWAVVHAGGLVMWFLWQGMHALRWVGFCGAGRVRKECARSV